MYNYTLVGLLTRCVCDFCWVMINDSIMIIIKKAFTIPLRRWSALNHAISTVSFGKIVQLLYIVIKAHL